MLVAVQLFVPGLYLPPVFKKLEPCPPPQTIISLPVQTAVCSCRAEGALIVVVAVQRIRAGIVSPASVRTAAGVNSTPNDHFTAGPDCRV